MVRIVIEKLNLHKTRQFTIICNEIYDNFSYRPIFQHHISLFPVSTAIDTYTFNTPLFYRSDSLTT